MDWRGIPSLNGLKAFSAVADTLNLSQAGRMLNVSHAAVSQQVRALEAHLGVSLVVRHGRGVALTPEGQDLAKSLEDCRNKFERFSERSALRRSNIR